MDINILSAIIFYSLIIILVYVFRKKFIIQNKVIALYKTKLGLVFMDKVAEKFPRLCRFLGYTGIVVGFLGMIFILYTVVVGAISLFTNPLAPPVVAPIIPGVKIPGSPIFVPFWYGIISIFVILVVHEFSHGIIARVHKVKVDSSGFGMMAIFPIAFVEPNEKDESKLSKAKKLSIYAAGPFANVLLALLVFAIAFGTYPAESSMVNYNGVYFTEVVSGAPAAIGGALPNVVYTMLDGKNITTSLEFVDILTNVTPGQKITLSNANSSAVITTGHNPDNESLAYLGVKGIISSYQVKSGAYSWLFYLTDMFNQLINWIFVLSIGIGLANLLPLGPVDGGKMVSTALNGFAKKKYAEAAFALLSVLVLILLIFNLLFPYLRNLF